MYKLSSKCISVTEKMWGQNFYITKSKQTTPCHFPPKLLFKICPGMFLIDKKYSNMRSKEDRNIYSYIFKNVVKRFYSTGSSCTSHVLSDI